MSDYWIIKYNRRAISLMEVMVTIVILSLGLTLIIRSFMMSFRASRLAKDYTAACLLAEEKLWEFEQAGYIAADLNDEGQFPEPNTKFNYKLETQKALEAEGEALNLVRLSISWQEAKKTNNILIETLLRNQQE